MSNIQITHSSDLTDEENKDWDQRYPTGGLPPQPFRTIIPAELPQIITPRLRLRGIKEGDAEGILETWRSLPVNGSWPQLNDLADVEDWMKRKIFTDPPLAAGRGFFFVITERDDPAGRIIGALGMNVVVPLPNVGYGLHYDAWGKGYATEAFEALMEAWWALPREEVPVDGDDNGEGACPVKDKVLANINKANPASMGVVAKCGFEVYREHTLKDGHVLVLVSAERPDESGTRS